MNLERVINRINSAGGEMSSAEQFGRAKNVPPELLARYRTVNMMIADLRRATAMCERGNPLEEVLKVADQMAAGLPLGGIPPSDPRHVEEVINHIANLNDDQESVIYAALKGWQDARP